MLGVHVGVEVPIGVVVLVGVSVGVEVLVGVWVSAGVHVGVEVPIGVVVLVGVSVGVGVIVGVGAVTQILSTSMKPSPTTSTQKVWAPQGTLYSLTTCQCSVGE